MIGSHHGPARPPCIHALSCGAVRRSPRRSSRRFAFWGERSVPCGRLPHQHGTTRAGCFARSSDKNSACGATTAGRWRHHGGQNSVRRVRLFHDGRQRPLWRATQRRGTNADCGRFFFGFGIGRIQWHGGLCAGHRYRRLCACASQPLWLGGPAPDAWAGQLGRRPALGPEF
jgi:hypothetical protein